MHQRFRRVLGDQARPSHHRTSSEPMRRELGAQITGADIPGNGGRISHSQHGATQVQETVRGEIHGDDADGAPAAATPAPRLRRVVTRRAFAVGALLIATGLGVVFWQTENADIPSVLQADTKKPLAVPDGPSIAAAVLQHERRSATGLLCRRVDPHADHGSVQAAPATGDWSSLRVYLQGASSRSAGKSGERWACATSSRAACRCTGFACASTSSWSRQRPARIYGQSGSIARSKTFSRFRTRSPAAFVEELDVTLVTGEQARAWRRLTKNPAAYSEALAGRAVQAKEHTIDAMLKSREHYKRAIELDPGFALPWAYMVSVLYTPG